MTGEINITDDLNPALRQINLNREIVEGVYLELLYSKAWFEKLIEDQKTLDYLDIDREDLQVLSGVMRTFRCFQGS